MTEPDPASALPPVPRRPAEDAPDPGPGRDPLTGLVDRAAFHAALRAALAAHPDDVAVLLLALDGFCCVDARHGCGAGDLLLRRVAACVAGAVRSGDVAARLGGDSFAVVLVPPAGDPDVHGAARRIAEGLADACEDGVDLGVRVCLGAAHSSEAPDAERLLALAASAMGRARDGAGHG